jgi:hypothetical protein
MAPKYHHPPLSGGDRKALTKEIAKSRAMTNIFAERSAETLVPLRMAVRWRTMLSA